MEVHDLLIAAFVLQAVTVLGMYGVLMHTSLRCKNCDLERLALLHHINENTENLVNLRRKEDREK